MQSPATSPFLAKNKTRCQRPSFRSHHKGKLHSHNRDIGRRYSGVVVLKDEMHWFSNFSILGTRPWIMAKVAQSIRS